MTTLQTQAPAYVFAHQTLETPVGALRIYGDDAGLRAIALPGDTQRATEARMNTLYPGYTLTEENLSLQDTIAQLQEYFAGKRQVFTLPLAQSGTPFQQQVWRALLDVPYGATCSYGDIARAIGNPAAFRAVGLANGINQIPIIVPCHRVIGAHGDLTGYGGGLQLKRWLLDLEAKYAVQR